MDLILNELSLSNVPNIHKACELMENFIMVCKKAVSFGAERNIRTKESFTSHLLFSEYPISKWLNNPNIDIELRRYFKTLTTRTPYIDSIEEKEIYDKYLCYEFLLEDKESIGLGIAYLLESLAISFDCDPKWDNHLIDIKMRFLDDDDSIVEEDITIKHACKPNHILHHNLWFASLKKNSVNDIEDMWTRKERLFPNLIFFNSSKDYITNVNHKDPLFKQIIKRLFELEDYFSNWNDGHFNPDIIKCKVTPESHETLTKFEKEHSFQDAQGVYYIFSWHARLTPGSWRIFFSPDEVLRKGKIGHIGPKLSNVSYPT